MFLGVAGMEFSERAVTVNLVLLLLVTLSDVPRVVLVLLEII